MRFKKGSKVEVLDEGEVPSGTWRCAEIISGNGHYYSVKYDSSSGITSANFIEQIPSKAIRPHPPPVEGVKNWAVGDVVEVFDDCSWKVGTILKVLSRNYYLVRLLATCKDYKVQRSAIRVRQSWKDNKWIMITKGSGNCENIKFRKPSVSNNYQRRGVPTHPSEGKMKVQAGDGRLGIQKITGYQNPDFETSRALKRASHFSISHVEADLRPQKLRAVGKHDMPYRGVSGCAIQSLNKVDAVAYPRENLGDTDTCASSNQNAVFNEMERGGKIVRFFSFPGKSSEPRDSSSDACSVGSCSVISSSANSLYSPNLSVPIPSEEADSISSKSESFVGHGGEEGNQISLPPRDDVPEKIHRLELHAYRCTLEALYASGPLSWEQEAMLTNLRLSLHISNDEHMMELKNLISGGIGSLMS